MSFFMPKGSCTVTQDDGVPVIASSGAIATLHDAVVDTIKLGAVRFEGGYVYAAGRVDDVLVYLKAKISALEDTKSFQSLTPYKMKVEAGVASVWEKADSILVQAQGSAAVQQVLETYSRLRKALIDYISVVQPKLAELYKSSLATVQMRVAALWEPSIAYAKNGFAFVSGKVGNMSVLVKARGDFARQRALTAYATVSERACRLVRPVLENVVDRSGGIKVKVADIFQPYWIKIEGELLHLKVKLGDVHIHIKARLSDVLGRMSSSVEPIYARVKGDCSDLLTKAGERAGPLKTKASQAYESALNIASQNTATLRTYMEGAGNRASELSASDGVPSAAVLGTSGGAAGFVAGGAVGAAVGVVPAVFTFGLSIPIGAAIGSGAGLSIGAVTGAATGFVGGKVMGYGMKAHKDNIEKRMSAVFSTANACKDYVQGKLPKGTDKILSSTGSAHSDSSDELLASASGGTAK